MPKHIQHFCVFVSLVFQKVKHLFPELDVMHLRHQHALVTIGSIFYRAHGPVEMDHFSPDRQIISNIFLISVEVPDLYFIFEGQSLLSVHKCFLVGLVNLFC